MQNLFFHTNTCEVRQFVLCRKHVPKKRKAVYNFYSKKNYYINNYGHLLNYMFLCGLVIQFKIKIKLKKYDSK